MTDNETSGILLDNIRSVRVKLLKCLENIKKENCERRQRQEVCEAHLSNLNELITKLKAEQYKGSTAEDLIKECLDIYSTGVHIIESRLKTLSRMAEKFCLKTASSLIPYITDNEETVLSLIDAVDLYDSMLSTEQDKKLLINFVLKTRLKPTAKIRLNSEYNTVSSLLTDIKNNLLTIRSPSAIIQNIYSHRQTSSLDRFCKEIETMFSDLTLAQNSNKILVEENEKLVIRCFTNGLADVEIRGILKARKYEKLKDAIKDARDEEMLKSASSSQNELSKEKLFACNCVCDCKNNSKKFPQKAPFENKYYNGNNKPNDKFKKKNFQNSKKNYFDPNKKNLKVQTVTHQEIKNDSDNEVEFFRDQPEQ